MAFVYLKQKELFKETIEEVLPYLQVYQGNLGAAEKVVYSLIFTFYKYL